MICMICSAIKKSFVDLLIRIFRGKLRLWYESASIAAILLDFYFHWACNLGDKMKLINQRMKNIFQIHRLSKYFPYWSLQNCEKIFHTTLVPLPIFTYPQSQLSGKSSFLGALSAKIAHFHPSGPISKVPCEIRNGPSKMVFP